MEENNGFHLENCQTKAYFIFPLVEFIYRTYLHKAALLLDDRKSTSYLKYIDDIPHYGQKYSNSLKQLLRRIQEESVKAGLQLNFKKAEIMTTEKLHNLNVGNEEIKIGFFPIAQFSHP